MQAGPDRVVLCGTGPEEGLAALAPKKHNVGLREPSAGLVQKSGHFQPKMSVNDLIETGNRAH